MQHTFYICLPTPHLEGSSSPKMWKTEVFHVCVMCVLRFLSNQIQTGCQEVE